MTQYLLSLPHDTEESPTMESMDPADLQAALEAAGGFMERLQSAGVWVFAGGLHPPATAITVDNTGDTPVMTDGPFVEAKEYLGGFWVIDVPDLDAALEWAKDASKALGGRIEVRAFQDVPE
jgi:hypothetical protein